MLLTQKYVKKHVSYELNVLQMNTYIHSLIYSFIVLDVERSKKFNENITYVPGSDWLFLYISVDCE